MDVETFTVRRDRLLAATALVPEAQRAVFLATLFVGTEGTAHRPQVQQSAAEQEKADASEGPTSFPLSLEQARELRGKVDEATWSVLKAMVANARDDVGTIEWPEVKRITGVANWVQFAKGRMGGLHRSLRSIAGVPRNAVLIWEGEGWIEDGKGDYSTGTVAIDGPSVRTLRAIFGFSTEK